MRRYPGWLTILLPALFGGAAFADSTDWLALGRRWWSHVQVLADDNMEGRATGSRGYERAAEYVIQQFRSAGLRPAGVDGFRQPVDFHVSQIDPARCALDLMRDGKVHPVKLGDDAAIVVTSQTADSIEAEAVFA